MDTKEELEKVLSGLRKVYKELKSESAKKKMVEVVKRLKETVGINIDDETYEKAKEIFGNGKLV